MRRGLRIVLVSILVNSVLAFIKVVAGVLGHSHALIADGIESTMDIISSSIVWGGLRVAERPPDDNHPYGHGKAENLAGVIVSLALFGAALLIAIQSLREIFTPQNSPRAFTLIVLISVIIIKLIFSRVQLKIGHSINSVAIKTDAWHHRLDALTSMAAFVGISLSLLLGEAFAVADDIAALFVSLIIGYNGYRLFRNAISDIMDEAPSQEFEMLIRQVAGEVPGVINVEKFRARKSGLGYFVELHVEVDEHISVRKGHEIAHRVKDVLEHSERLDIIDALIHIEPFPPINKKELN
ncbi:MAG: cation transporter [Calditrichaeota bacterium]|nr:MAG: cation transporter [Calditrichota bacterium]